MQSSSGGDGSSGADSVITALYRACLLRDPEAGAIENWRPRVTDEGLESVLSQFLRSAEFGLRIGSFVNLFPFDQAPAQQIEMEIDAPALERLWRRVARTWTALGNEDAYFSVLTDPQWSHLAQASRIEAFYATGEGDLTRLEAWLARNRLAIDPDGVAVEYGCGVGRFTEWLAPRCRSVVAIDVSESHLDLARKRGEAKRIEGQVRYVGVASPADLTALAGADLFYSVIVLQHNPPPIIATILDAAFAGLNRGGVAYFQVPTRGAEGYAFDVQTYLQADGDGWMEMHAIEQSAVFKIAERRGVRPVEVSPDHCAGRFGVSTTFLMKKD